MASRKPGRSSRRAASRPRAGAKRRKPAARARSAARSRKPAPARAAAKPRPKRATAKPAARPAGAAPSALAPNGKPVGTGIGLTHHHMDYSTHDQEAMRRFFVDTLGFTNVLHIPEHQYLTVFVTPTSSLGFMPPMGSAPEAWQPPGEPNFYFYVADVDAAYAALTAKGVIFDQPPTDMPWGHRLAVLRDPEGRRVCLAQNLKR